jgi:CBS domain-containing protein
MNVGRLCKRQVVTVTPQQELVSAAELMREKHIGFLIVVEEYGRPIGVLTDRDIVVSVVAKGANPSLLSVADIMTRDPATADEGQSLDGALRTMRRMGVRRLPVVGSKGLLTGILSLDDVLDVLAAELAEVSGAVRNEQHIEGVLRS